MNTPPDKQQRLTELIAGLREPVQMRERENIDFERAEAAYWLEKLSALSHGAAPNTETAGVPMGDPHPLDEARAAVGKLRDWVEGSAPSSTVAIHHDFDLERISLALVDAVDAEFARNEILRLSWAGDKEYRLRTIAAVNERTLKGWIDLIIKPLVAKYDRHIKSMQRIVERSEAPASATLPRNEALEAAALLCDGLQERCSAACANLDGDGTPTNQSAYWRADGGADAAVEMAAAIRALKSGATPDGSAHQPKEKS